MDDRQRGFCLGEKGLFVSHKARMPFCWSLVVSGRGAGPNDRQYSGPIWPDGRKTEDVSPDGSETAGPTPVFNAWRRGQRTRA
jgi:hypothetical protein